MRRSKEVALDVLLHFEEELNARALAEFLQFLRRLYRLEAISYVCPSLSLWLIQDPCLALAYSDAWLDHCAAKADPAGEGQDAALDWTFLPRIEAEMGRMQAEADVEFGGRGFIIRLSGPGNALTGLLWVTADDDDASWEQRRAKLNRGVRRHRPLCPSLRAAHACGEDGGRDGSNDAARDRSARMVCRRFEGR